MYDTCIELIERPEDDLITLHVYCENDELFQLGQRINERFENAYMNGYNWEVLIDYDVKRIEPTLLSAIVPDPEAGLYAADMRGCNPANLQTMKRFEAHVRALLKDEQTVTSFIEKHYKDIEWD